jgi:hypothetical protein
MRKIILTLVAAVVLSLGATACGDSNADKVGENIGKEAEKFNVQRKILFVNAITDKVLWEVEGRCSIEQNGALPRNLEVICKHGPDNYKKHFLGLSDNVTWISTQMEGIDVSEYRTKIIFRPESIVPDLDLVTGD